MSDGVNRFGQCRIRQRHTGYLYVIEWYLHWRELKKASVLCKHNFARPATWIFNSSTLISLAYNPLEVSSFINSCLHSSTNLAIFKAPCLSILLKLAVVKRLQHLCNSTPTYKTTSSHDRSCVSQSPHLDTASTISNILFLISDTSWVYELSCCRSKVCVLKCDCESIVGFA